MGYNYKFEAGQRCIRKTIYNFLHNYNNWLFKDYGIRTDAYIGLKAGFSTRYDSVKCDLGSPLVFKQYALLEDSDLCCDVYIYPQAYTGYTDDYIFEYGNSANIIRTCYFSSDVEVVDYELICKLNDITRYYDDTQLLVSVDKDNKIVVKQTFDCSWLYTDYYDSENYYDQEIVLSDKDKNSIVRTISNFCNVSFIMDIISDYSNTGRINEACERLRDCYMDL